MAQLGHADPKMTLGIYARVMLDGEDERNRLRDLIEGRACATPRSVTMSELGAKLGVKAMRT